MMFWLSVVGQGVTSRSIGNPFSEPIPKEVMGTLEDGSTQALQSTELKSVTVQQLYRILKVELRM
jgi:hypothetical protein